MNAKYLILVNKNLSNHTAKFWRKNEAIILSELTDADLCFWDSDQPQTPIDLDNREVVVLIGDISFFHRIVNCFFTRLANVIVAFIPDKKNSVLTASLQIPTKTTEVIELIKCRQTIPLDIIRCHYIDEQGLPENCLVLNDVVIGVSSRQFPPSLRTFFQLCKNESWIPFTKKENVITLLRNRKTIYHGKYFLSLILLGSRITNGPKIVQKKRINLTTFDYFQLNAQTAIEITSLLTGMYTKFSYIDNRNVLHRQFSEIEIHGLGKNNNLISDGIYIGRLPASFTLLPKALKVISPLNVITVKRPWAKKIAVSQKVPTPIGSREVL